MSDKLQPVRGTHDILPDDFEKFHWFVEDARQLATLYGFREMATPIFEQTEVFSRSMGESSDVVSKEMFTFETRGGESVTLRPEFTAGIARAFISNGMQQNLPLKLFSTGPLFRYERPQKGRQRQFHQVNFEWLGDDSWMADVEVIALAATLLYGLSKQNCTLHINSLGDVESRNNYRNALVAYLTPFLDKLSEDSKRRLTQNPLRILDSKDGGDREILKNAPLMTDYLSAESKERLDKVCKALQDKSRTISQNIIIDPTLVRGLDYYNGIVFEFVANTGEIGAQNTVLAGGRYDGLIEEMGGKSTPAIGFAAGIERLLLLVDNEDFWVKPKDLKIYILPEEDPKVDKILILSLADSLRFCISDILKKEKIKRLCSVEILWQGSQKKKMEKANKQEATHVILFSAHEAERRVYIIKDMKNGEQKEATAADFVNAKKLAEIFGI